MLFIGVCRELGGLLPVACGMYRYVCYRCVPDVWGIAVGSLWLVAVCVLYVCGLLGGLLSVACGMFRPYNRPIRPRPSNSAAIRMRSFKDSGDTFSITLSHSFKIRVSSGNSLSGVG